ncbi:CotY/CotZ family spore coat protein [Aciduricibacillus chroicocephali]|uniref:CotY/CotZ family spore coat protein n=1 Tax=Aciduricibacillus chroicocephali TaxID=3054939 RepID=A0ABY9L0J1_9BACI|nr:CotY/CotZ family spore coat protein [Bacillaceae bacterium 44XB]
MGQKQEGEHKDCHENCICKVLKNLLETQRKRKGEMDTTESCTCSINRGTDQEKEPISFILQTPYGHPFFTWGKIGKKDCFATVFFTVEKVDCKENCALLRLMKPNKTIIDPDTECIESSSICGVDYVVPTKECVFIKLDCYSAVKLTSADFIKSKSC